MNLVTFIETLVQYGLEYFKVYPGLYRGVVTRVDDPEKRGRVQAFVPQVGQLQAPNMWIKPSFAGAGANRGTFWPPEVGDSIFVSFARGNPSKPELYFGGWFGYPDQESEVPAEFAYSNSAPQKRGLVTRLGHGLIFSDEKDNEYVRLFWHKIAPGDEAASKGEVTGDRSQGEFAFVEFTKEGSIQLSNKKGSYVFMDAADPGAISIVSQHGHAITMTEKGVTMVDAKGNLVTLDDGKLNLICDGTVNINAKTVNIAAGGVHVGAQAQQSVILGELFMAMFNSHTHPTGVGPSGPPVVPMTPAQLSKSVKVKS